MLVEWLSVSFLLAFLSLDVSAVGQFMLSRPIVAGPLVGLLTGHSGLGLEMGALIELIWIGDVPVGAHLPLDLLMLTGISVGFASSLPEVAVPREAVMTFALGVAIPLAMVSTEAENLLRKFHVRWVHWAQRMASQSRFHSFEWINSLVLTELFLKGFLVASLGLVLAHLTSGFFSVLSPKVIEGLYYAHWLLLALGCSAVIDLLVEKKTAVYLALSILAVSLSLFFRVQGAHLVFLMVLVGFVAALLHMGREESAR